MVRRKHVRLVFGLGHGGEQGERFHRVRRSFQLFEHLLGAFDGARWQTGEPGHLNAIGPIGRSWLYIVQEDQLVFPLFRAQRQIGGGRQVIGEAGQLMIMGGEQRPN